MISAAATKPPVGFRSLVFNALRIPPCSAILRDWTQRMWDTGGAFLDVDGMLRLESDLLLLAAASQQPQQLDSSAGRSRKDEWVLQNLFSPAELNGFRTVVDFGGADGWFGALFPSVAQLVVVETDAARFPASGYGWRNTVVDDVDCSSSLAVVLWDGKEVESSHVPAGTADVVCFRVSLHHMDAETQAAAVRSAHRLLRPSGVCIVKEHDVDSPTTARLSDLQHALFVVRRAVDADADADRRALYEHFWTHEKAEYRSRAEWKALFERAGFRSQGMRDRFGQRRSVHPGSNNLTKLYWEVFRKNDD